MCGLAGVYGRPSRQADRNLLLAMAGELRHRGPDGAGLYLDGSFGMTNTRLAIVDLEGGDQPLSDERGRYWVMQNGEIYNHVELRAELEHHGHRFTTTSDTEVIAHAYEEWGVGALQRFNGDFAIAVWDRRLRELLLARDRFGVRPLFLAELDGDLCFASEAKALLRHPAARRELDPAGLVELFTTWSNLPERSAFAGVRELPPAHFVRVTADGRLEERRWWDIDFSARAGDGASEEALVEELRELLVDSTRIRLRADVPVGAYLSGGLDSSATAAIAQTQTSHPLSAFGVGFTEERFDEGVYQDRIVEQLGVAFTRARVDGPQLAALLPRAIELAEKPTLRTAPAPLLLLSGAVRDAGLKVVLTGEGADELFAGYDIFREDQVRRFWARDPESRLRPLLLTRLNEFLAGDLKRSSAFLAGFYGRGLTDLDDPLYSHRIRFGNTARCVRILSQDVRAQAEAVDDPLARLIGRLPQNFGEFSALGRAQYIEIVSFLEGYLLHSQGDRMLMGHSIEGRFPFLDFRVAEFAARLPDRLRLRGTQEKYALRKAVAPFLPPEISQRRKQPYRAPIGPVFFAPGAPAYVDEILRPAAVAERGLFDPKAVERVAAKFRATDGKGVSETDEMALVGILSTTLLHEQLIAAPRLAAPVVPGRVVVGDTVQAQAVAQVA